MTAIWGDTAEIFDRYRAWLLKPQKSANEQWELFFNDIPQETLEAHDWAGETALTDVTEYSHVRLGRLIRNNFRVPPIVLHLAFRQMFQAQDMLLPIDEDYVVLLGRPQFKFPVEIDISQMARSTMLGDYEADLEKYEVAPATAHMDDEQAERMRDVIRQARFEHDSIYTNRLIDLLSPAEFNEALSLQPSIRAELYPAAAEGNDSLWRQHLIRTDAYTQFKHYDKTGKFIETVNR